MADLVKTTVTIPEDILQAAKLQAVREKTTLSSLIREALRGKVASRKKRKVKDPMKLLGKYSLGIKKIYNKRSDLYHEHIKRKMGF